MKPLEKTDVQPCDVLLYHGTTPLISNAIMLLDGTQYSHASIVLDSEHVVETLPGGVVRRSITCSVTGPEFVDVYRLKKDGQFIGAPGFPVGPVVEKIEVYLKQGDRFAYEEILLLAVLTITRKIPSVFLRWILDEAAGVVAEMVALGREPMICSELVYRCFAEAGEKYRPRILGAEFKSKLESISEWRAYGYDGPYGDEYGHPNAEWVVDEFIDLYAAAKKFTERQELLDPSPNPNFVTPGDLSKSPDLKRIGKLTPYQSVKLST